MRCSTRKPRGCRAHAEPESSRRLDTSHQRLHARGAYTCFPLFPVVPTSRQNIRMYRQNQTIAAFALCVAFAAGGTTAAPTSTATTDTDLEEVTLFEDDEIREAQPERQVEPEAELAFEDEPEYRADQLVETSLLSGPSWQIVPQVPVRGYLAQFRLATDYGYLNVEGRAELAERIFELEAVAQLAAISRSRAFVDAMAHSSKDIAKTIARIGTHPIETVKSIPAGLWRNLRSKWRALGEQSAKARDQASEKWHEDDTSRGVGPQAAMPHARETDWWLKSQETSGKLAKRWIGFTAARRKLAQRLGVDPYTRNALLNRELDRIAWASLGGDKGLGLAIDAVSAGAGSVIGQSRKLDDIVWQLDPATLGQQQRERMAALCGEDPSIAKAMNQGALSPSQWQRLVDAMEAMHIRRCASVLALIGATSSDAEARYLVRALDLVEMHRDPGADIDLIEVGGLLVARIDGRRVIVPMPVDVLSWTQPIATLFDDTGLRAAQREMWLDGEATPRAQRELTQRGFGLRLDLPRSTRSLLPMPRMDGR